ncbi:MAG: HAD family hydrolase [Candidatus Thermoplasmatota archaeon]|nr:HAD family hydrolase [Candidatus Thermoplasmatota archaeon]
MSEIPKLIIFDLDNTLYDDVGAVKKALFILKSENEYLSGMTVEDLFKKYYTMQSGIQERYMNGELTLDQIGLERFRKFISETGGPEDEGEINAIYERFNYLHVHCGRAVPGAKGLLGRLKRDHVIGIITNHIGRLQQRKIEKIGIGKYVDFVIAAYDVRMFKPEPEIFSLAMNYAGVSPEDAVMVGDSWEHDIQGAVSAGIRAVWVNRRKLESPSPEAAVEIRTFVPIHLAESAILKQLQKYCHGKPVDNVNTRDDTKSTIIYNRD